MSSAEQPAGTAPAVLIGVPVYGQLELVERAIRALDQLSPTAIEFMIIDDCGTDRLTEAMLAGWLPAGRQWRLISHQTNVGFVGTVNELFELADERDVLVVNSDVEVLPGWFDGLAAAIASRTGVASASTLASQGSLLTVPELSKYPDGTVLAAARSEVAVAEPIPAAVAHCTWFTRAAIERVGLFDRRFDPGYGEEVDWSLRAARRGFVHLAALHSFVRHDGGASFTRKAGFWTLARRHELVLLRRYPVRWLRIRSFARDQSTPFALALHQIRQRLARA